MFKALLKLIILSVICLYFCNCKNWVYNVEKNDIHFKKIYQSKNGTYVAYMINNHDIKGIPCKNGWIHFKKDWKLLSCQLSKDFLYKNTLLPAHTWFHFPYHEGKTGYVCSFPINYEVQGFLCGGSGGYKGTHTGFYESGKLKSFFPDEDLIIKKIPCKASLFVNVQLYENGNVKSCKLSKNYQLNEKIYKKNKIVKFDENGKIIE